MLGALGFVALSYIKYWQFIKFDGPVNRGFSMGEEIAPIRFVEYLRNINGDILVKDKFIIDGFTSAFIRRDGNNVFIQPRRSWSGSGFGYSAFIDLSKDEPLLDYREYYPKWTPWLLFVFLIIVVIYQEPISGGEFQICTLLVAFPLIYGVLHSLAKRQVNTFLEFCMKEYPNKDINL